MKKAMLLLLVLFVGSFIVGCDEDELSLSKGAGMVDSRAERRRRLAAINDINNRQIQDDWDEFWLIDTSCRLTEWHVYIGH